MASNIAFAELVSSSLQSQESLVTTILALSSQNSFTPLLEQLNAFRSLLTFLQQVPAKKDTEFNNIKDLLQSTGRFCRTIMGDIQEKSSQNSTNWSSLNRLGDNVDSCTKKL
jgi:hypothetical protein